MAAPAYTIHSSGGSTSAQQAESPHSPRFYRHNPSVINFNKIRIHHHMEGQFGSGAIFMSHVDVISLLNFSNILLICVQSYRFGANNTFNEKGHIPQYLHNYCTASMYSLELCSMTLSKRNTSVNTTPFPRLTTEIGCIDMIAQVPVLEITNMYFSTARNPC